MKGPVIARKKRRAPLIAANGVVLLAPSALFLAARAADGNFDTLFYAVQALELLAGGLNAFWMIGNIRDGLKLRPRHRPA